MILIDALFRCFDELLDMLGQVSEADYTKPCRGLSGATIGEHTRHIIEMFECLEQHEDGKVNYDNRARDPRLQNHPDFAAGRILKLKQDLSRPQKILFIEQAIGSELIAIESNYDRELLHNLEHCIHHQALMKVALLDCPQVKMGAYFGVGRSTIAYRNPCAQ